MKSDNIILISIILFIIFLLGIEVVFKKSSVLKENFQGFNYNVAVRNMQSASATSTGTGTGAGTGSPTGDIRSDTAHINSIVSKHSGKVLNCEALEQPPTRKVTIPFFDERNRKKSLSVNNDGTYSLVTPNRESIRQHFAVVYIDSVQTYRQHIPLRNANLGYDIDDAKYPFYILKSLVDPSKGLQYQDGNVMVRPIANYDSQKWDVSTERIEGVIGAHRRAFTSKLTGDVRSNPDELGSNEYGDMDKIKIKLNLDNQVLNSFLEKNLDRLITQGNNDTDNESDYDINDGRISTGGSGGSCNFNTGYGDRVPNDAIRSLCPGCNPDNL